MGWVPAKDGYEVSLVAGKVVCRNGGKPLKSLPKSLKDDDAVIGLRQLAEWLDRHATACAATVEDWMVRSLPTPASVLREVWADTAWRAPLRDLVVAPVDEKGWHADRAGFLRDVDADGRLGVVNLDGESVWLDVERVVLPHPVLLDDLDEIREFAVDLGCKQGVLQLFREIWRKPADAAAAAREYSGGHFAQLRHLTSRATSLGYAVRGGYASRRLWDAGRAVDACVWVGSEDPSYETETGDLVFIDAAGGNVPLADVGPVAWSEGMRMAAALYAGRVVPQEAAA